MGLTEGGYSLQNVRTHTFALRFVQHPAYKARYSAGILGEESTGGDCRSADAQASRDRWRLSVERNAVPVRHDTGVLQ